ncbi:MAG: radical SAM family heme chaperone HemW [Planctomycetes bacterium]|nr:radical SAM family heme chaperone HemW [Planctomycetota bacterium]
MPRAAYVHVPFCRRRCGYCAFTVLAAHDAWIPRYLAAVERELADLGAPREVDTLYFGGGTPSHLPRDAMRRLAEATTDRFPLAENGEWTVEANPADVTRDWCRTVRERGVTRISLGVQSFSPRKLRVLERDHDARRIDESLRLLFDAGLDVAIDLIFGVPGESVEEWDGDLRRAVAASPHHLSTYGLTFERGARFWGRRARGDITPESEDSEAELFERAIDVLTSAGFEHYEVSNFARPGHRCIHNETYWLGRSYHGVGPGAAAYVDGRRMMNHQGVLAYIRRVERGESPVVDWEMLDAESRARERLVFGLRRLEGVARGAFQTRTGHSIDDLAGSAVERFVSLGLLEDDGSIVRLTRRGLMVSDAMWPDLLRPEVAAPREPARSNRAENAP